MQTRRFPQIPQRIERLEELAYNLKWSWDYRARLLFKRLDPDLWKNTQHNPVKLLHTIEPVRFSQAVESLAGSEVFLEIGPHPVLSVAISQTLDQSTVFASLRRYRLFGTCARP